MDFHFNGLQHIGIPTDVYDATCRFYEKLGFVCRHENRQPSGGRVAFYEQGGLMLEIYEAEQTAGCPGAVDHIALNATDIEQTYAAAQAAGLTVVSNGIEALPFWERGVRFFIVKGPNSERVEFCQML